MRNLKAIIAYDGTNYYGFQRQVDVPTVQDALEDGLYHLTQEEINLIAASRTDRGVHAQGQVVNFETTSPIPVDRFRFAWDNAVADDILIKEVTEVPADFHARYQAQGKIYEYQLLNQTLPSVFARNYTYHIKQELDYQRLEKAASYLVGVHDFASFQTSGSSVNSTVRTIEEFSMDFEEENRVKLRIAGDGFLYNMVRIIVGTLIKIATERLDPEVMSEIIAAQDRRAAGPTAPACGLRLIKVKY
ncbi:MAG: tRNA pseudouridine(38-40) synthase TruA [Bacillota bacterium]